VPEDPRPLREDARRLQLLFDVDYAIYMIDLDERVASWNSGAARLMGYSTEDIIGQPFARFFTPADQAREFPQQALAAAARPGGSSPKAGGCAATAASLGLWQSSTLCAITTAGS
jgi:PAS domain-containing protein